MYKKILFILLLFTLFGCSEKKATEKSFIDSYGEKVEYGKEYKRVVSIAPNITEIIYALGAGDKIVGRSSYCNYPKEAVKKESVGDLMNPDFEKIVSLKPDIVLSSTHVNRKSVEKLKSVGIKTASLYGGDSFEGVYGVISEVAKITGKENDAAAKIAEMKNRVEKLRERTEKLKRPKVYYMISYGKYGDYSAGKDTFINELIDIAGGYNIASDTVGWKYGLERIVEHDPDIIICPKSLNAARELRQINGYAELRAVKTGNVYEIDGDKIDRQAIRVVDGLYEIAAIIHPELFK